jgi:hypothetical protein
VRAGSRQVIDVVAIVIENAFRPAKGRSVHLYSRMTIADEVDAQLTQSTDSYMNAMRKAAAA